MDKKITMKRRTSRVPTQVIKYDPSKQKDSDIDTTISLLPIDSSENLTKQILNITKRQPLEVKPLLDLKLNGIEVLINTTESKPILFEDITKNNNPDPINNTKTNIKGFLINNESQNTDTTTINLKKNNSDQIIISEERLFKFQDLINKFKNLEKSFEKVVCNPSFKPEPLINSTQTTTRNLKNVNFSKSKQAVFILERQFNFQQLISKFNK